MNHVEFHVESYGWFGEAPATGYAMVSLPASEEAQGGPATWNWEDLTLPPRW